MEEEGREGERDGGGEGKREGGRDAFMEERTTEIIGPYFTKEPSIL